MGQEDGRSGSTLTRLPLKEAEGLPGEMAELRQAVGAAGDDDLLRLPEIGLSHGVVEDLVARPEDEQEKLRARDLIPGACER